jgi:hypothetical protein
MNKEEFKNPIIDVLLKADHTTSKKYETETPSGFLGFYDLEGLTHLFRLLKIWHKEGKNIVIRAEITDTRNLQ